MASSILMIQMRILCPSSFKCIQHFKVSHFSTVISKYSSANYFSQRNSTFFLTPNRSFSWEGFYISIASSTPVLTAQNLLLNFHSYSDLPWWAVISLSTLAIRSCLVFPLAVHQNQVIARIDNINAELMKMAPELNKEVNIAAKMYGWNENTARKVYRKNMRQYYKKFIVRDNCHPFKIILLALFQIPAWICFSIALRNLCMFSVEDPDLKAQLSTEGVLWFTDLTIPDQFFIPVLLTLVNLLLIEITSLKQIGVDSKFKKYLLNFSRAIVVLVGGAATLNPTAVTFYWLCSSILGAAQNVILFSPKFRRFLRIPKTTKESATPFQDIASNFKKRFSS